MMRWCAAIPALLASLTAAAGETFDYGLQPRQVAPGNPVLAGRTAHSDACNSGNIVNVGIVATGAGVVVVDSGPSRRQGKQLRRAIRQTRDYLVWLDRRLRDAAERGVDMNELLATPNPHPRHWSPRGSSARSSPARRLTPIRASNRPRWQVRRRLAEPLSPIVTVPRTAPAGPPPGRPAHPPEPRHARLPACGHDTCSLACACSGHCRSIPRIDEL